MLPNLASARSRLVHRHPLPATVAVLALAAVALLSSCQRAEEQVAPEIRPVRTITVDKRAAGDTVPLTGTVQAQTEINQSFRIDGRLLERALNVGDAVRPGQLVARLDSQNEESSVQSARAQLTGARARLAEAQNNFTRMRDLVAENAVSRASFDQAEAGLKTAQAQVESAQSQVTLAENRLSYTRLVSDRGRGGDGAGRGAGRGRRRRPHDRPGRPRRRARRGVRRARAGQGRGCPRIRKSSSSLTSDPKVTANGVVREIAPRADPVTGTFRVKVRLVNPPPAMRLGTTVTGRMKLASTTASRCRLPP